MRAIPGIIRLVAGCGAAVASACAATPRPAPAPTPGSAAADLASFIRTQVFQSLAAGAGRRPDQYYVARDSASVPLLRAAGIVLRLASGAEPACPMSTDSAGQPLAGPEGYWVEIEVSVHRRPGARSTLEVMEGCARWSGTRRWEYYQGLTWPIARRGGHWHVVAGPIAVVVT